MAQLPIQPKGLPAFQRPSEAVVFWMLENLCGGAGGRCKLSLGKLARRCGLSVSTTNRAVLGLAARGLIRYRRGYNQSRPSIFELPLGGAELPANGTARRKIGIPNPNDSDSDSGSDITIGDNDIGGVVHRQNAESDISPADRLAYRVADGLDDRKNLALYRSYCRRFPAEVILKAFARAREPAPDKIKKSRGALFNFLVQLYAKKRNTTNYPGHSAWPAADGRGRA